MIKMVADSAADIPKSVIKELEIEILPFMINIDGKQIVADENLDPNDFYDMVENCVETPTTSQMSPADIEDIYRKLGKDDPIIHITISSAASGVNSTANIVAAQLNEEGYDITVIDSTMFSYTIGRALVEGARMAKAGATKEEIINHVTEVYNRDTAYFVVDDLTYLRKSGRIKATSMVVSKALDIKPILKVNDGKVEAFRKVRGTKKALTQLVDFIEERMHNPEENEIIIFNSRCDEMLNFTVEQIKERINPKTITPWDIGPIITSHVGVGVLGVYFKHKKKYTEYQDK